MPQTPRHNVFISYHHQMDQHHKDEFVRLMGSGIVDKSVRVDDIDDDNLHIDTIRQNIRDNFVAPASVTVVLIGRCTWRRKHVDWEIAASLMQTEKNHRCGLLGILLPDHPNFGERTYNKHLIPPRLADNCSGRDAFASIYDWPRPWDANAVRDWIDKAFTRRRRTPYPNNSRPHFGRNWTRRCSDGWVD